MVVLRFCLERLSREMRREYSITVPRPPHFLGHVVCCVRKSKYYYQNEHFQPIVSPPSICLRILELLRKFSVRGCFQDILERSEYAIL